MGLDKKLLDLYTKGKDDPVFFVENVIGMTHLWEKQKEIAHSVRDNKFTAVRSSNGVGKTFSTANLTAWFLSSYKNSIVITTAPTSRQVRELLWQEIRNIHANSKYPLGGDTTQVSWTMGEKWFALGLSTDDPNRFQGFHAEHILGIIDEGAGVDAPIWEGMNSILTSVGARLLVIGNPTEPSGKFYEAFSSPLYNKIHISAFDTPNFTKFGITLEDIRTGEWQTKIGGRMMPYPTLITPEWVYERLTEWGEESPAFQSRILGDFPSIGNDTMIPLGWVLRAKERDINFDTKDIPVIGVDVARFGDDESVIAVVKGANLTRLDSLFNIDVNPLSVAVARIADSEGNFKMGTTHPGVITVDAVGIGAGVASNLRAWGYNAVDFVAQGRAWEQDKFINLRTEAWFRLRERFRKNDINIPSDEILIGQLTSPKYDYDASGRYRLESKEAMKKRGLKSPDKADAVMMAFNWDNALTVGRVQDIPQEKKLNPDSVEAMLRNLSKKRGEGMEWNTAKL